MSDHSKAFQTALALMNAEETARLIGEKITKPITVNTSVKVAPQPKISDMPWKENWSIGVGEEKTFLSVRGNGEVEELLVKASASSFVVTIIRDGKTVIGHTYTQLANLSQEVQTIQAYTRSDKYVVHVDNIGFKEELVIKVANSGVSTLTVDRIFAKYYLHEGQLREVG